MSREEVYSALGWLGREDKILVERHAEGQWTPHYGNSIEYKINKMQSARMGKI